MMTGTVCNAPEIRSPILEKPLERATRRFNEAVALGEQLARAEMAWVALGRLLTVIERDQDYETMGFETMGACMVEIELLSGYSRASAYAFKKLYAECSANGAEVPEMPLSSGHVFKKLPAKAQRDPKVKEAARKTKPKQFMQDMAEQYPEAHIDPTEDVKLHLESTFVPIFHEVIEAMRVIEDDPLLSYERALELAFLAWINELWGEPEAGITNLARARQLRGLAAEEIRRGGRSV